MKRNKLTLIIFLAFFIIGAGTFYFFGKDISQKFFGSKDTNVPGGAISKNEPVVTCGTGDKACQSKNNKILANRLEGPTAKFVSHQCDGPRACPTPTEDQEKEFISAIRTFAKDPKLELIPINGITPTGMIYYCTQDNRCWSYNTKDKQVALLEEENDTPSASTSATEN